MRIKCEICNKEFYVSTSDYKKGQRCCTRECSNIKRKLNTVLKSYVCKVCGKEFSRYKDTNHANKYCSRECYYKGRIERHKDFSLARIDRGYKLIYVNGYPVKNHIYIMEQYLGRKLNPNEVVHHKNFNPLDNRIENLQLMTRAEHTGLHAKLRDKKRDNITGRFITINKEG